MPTSRCKTFVSCSVHSGTRTIDANAMLYRRYIPAAPLDAYVACLWYSEGTQGAHARERLLPNGESGIVIDLREQPVRIYHGDDPARFTTHPPAIFCGARSDCFVIDTSRQERVIGIQFLPGGALPFLPMPACEVANQTCALDDLWPGEDALLREELLSVYCLAQSSAEATNAMFRVLEKALLSRLASGPHLAGDMRFAVRQLNRPGVPLRVHALADQVGLSSSRFIRCFEQQIGLKPKAFQRVRRFQRVLQALHLGTQQGWAALAADCGYYDQAHFIHDFRAFSGMTPSAYVLAATPHLNHVPLP